MILLEEGIGNEFIITNNFNKEMHCTLFYIADNLSEWIIPLEDNITKLDYFLISACDIRSYFLK